MCPGPSSHLEGYPEHSFVTVEQVTKDLPAAGLGLEIEILSK